MYKIRRPGAKNNKTSINIESKLIFLVFCRIELERFCVLYKKNVVATNSIIMNNGGAP